MDGQLIDELLGIASEVARGAGALLAERFQSGVAQEIRSKSTPTDLVSEADIEAERHIRREIADKRPHDGFLGEEGEAEQGSSGLRWVVDPLDGTVNYLFGIPQWCVSVALQDEQGSLVGAVYDPNRRELFTAIRGGPASLNGEHLEPPARRRQLETAMIATGFAYDAKVRAAQAKVLERLLPRVRDIRRFGSAALDLAWTATGRYDAYFERTVKPWDIAAGTLICECAGLQVLALGELEDLPWGILVAPDELADQLMRLTDRA